MQTAVDSGARRSGLTGQEIHFTDADFKWLCKLATEHAGIVLTDAKRQMVYSRLVRRLRPLGLTRFDQYCQRLQDGDKAEFVEFINAITTNLTSFFREPHHFEHLKNTVLPQILRSRGDARRIRIWSAGCSTGEEPYSIAMVVAGAVPGLQAWDIRILATDLDTNVLATAASGVYPQERVSGLSPARIKRWFVKGRGANAGFVCVRPELKNMIRFRQLNLIRPWPVHGPFDLIFCRNVVIYFNKTTQAGLFDRFADVTASDGHLYIGHSETLYRVCDRYESLGQTIYRKRG